MSATTLAVDPPRAEMCNLTFERDATTVDFQGRSIPPNEPRYGRTAAIPVLAHPWTSLTTTPTSLAEIYAAGRDVTGTKHLFAIRALDDCDCDVVDVELRRPSLDDVFLAITGSSPDDFGASQEVPS